MRIRPNDLGPYKRRAFAFPTVFDCTFERLITLEHVRAVAILYIQPGKALDQFRNIAARRSNLDRHRDRVAVVLDAEDDREFQVASGVESFPKFALAGRAIAD